VLVIGVNEILNDKYILMPEPDYKFKPDAVITMLGRKSSLDKFKLSKD